MDMIDETPIVGDMAIKDLTPKSTNIGNRLVKNMRICGSGVYTYARREAHLLHLDPVPSKYENLEFINVYRPPEVLNKYKDYFARVPIITGHHVRVDRDNAKALTVGMVGDTVDSEVDKDDGETYLYTTGTIIAGDGVDAYEQYGQLSVGYDPIMEWEEGIHNGIQYQAVLKGFNDVNHLLICKVARGGPQCMVMDSLDELSPLERFIHQNQKGGEDMSIFSKIFGSVHSKIVGDEGHALVPAYLDAITAGADPKIQVRKVREIVGDSDSTFNGYLKELEMAGDEKPEVVAKAVEIVSKYYKDNMCGDEKEDTKKTEEKKAEAEDESKPEEKTEEKKAEVGDEAKPEEKKVCSGDDMEAVISAVTDRVLKALAEKDNTPRVAGDEKEEVMNEYSMPIVGDESKTLAKSSDDYLKDIWG